MITHRGHLILGPLLALRRTHPDKTIDSSDKPAPEDGDQPDRVHPPGHVYLREQLRSPTSAPPSDRRPAPAPLAGRLAGHQDQRHRALREAREGQRALRGDAALATLQERRDRDRMVKVLLLAGLTLAACASSSHATRTAPPSQPSSPDTTIDPAPATATPSPPTWPSTTLAPTTYCMGPIDCFDDVRSYAGGEPAASLDEASVAVGFPVISPDQLGAPERIDVNISGLGNTVRMVWSTSPAGPLLVTVGRVNNVDPASFDDPSAAAAQRVAFGEENRHRSSGTIKLAHLPLAGFDATLTSTPNAVTLIASTATRLDVRLMVTAGTSPDLLVNLADPFVAVLSTS